MIRIFDIDKIPDNYLCSVGGKARGLYRLSKLGFAIPKAFVATGFDDDDDYSCIVEKYVSFGNEFVSVRSSATLEDRDDFSAAGQFSTFLNVCGADNLIKAVKDCIASLHNVTARNYTNAFLGKDSGKMTVIIQRMIDPRAAGVIFTKAPMHPGFSLVEAVPGLGENLVSGRMSAQQFRVRENLIEEMPDYPYISNGEAIKLAADGLSAEKAFKQPLDLEWAIDMNGKIWWLQARPITVAESVTVNELDCPLDASNFVLTTGNIGEMMPGAVTPLNLSTNMYALDWGVKETFARIGACPRSFPPYSFIAPYYNHMFFNMTNMYLMCHTTLGSTKESLDMSICGHLLEGFPDNPMKKAPILRRIVNTIPFIRLVFGGESAKKGMQRIVGRLRFNLNADIRSIYSQIIENFDCLKWAQYYHYCASYYSGGQSNMLLLSAWKRFSDKNELKALLSGCLSQIEDFESANILRNMIFLSEMILKDCPEASKYEVDDLKKYMERASPEVLESYSAFMERHGHRGIREPEIMSLPWRENPDSFFLSLKSVLSSVGENTSRTERSWTEFQEELLSHFKGKLLRKMITGMVKRARKGVCYREYTKSRTIFVLDQFRQAYRKLASLMVQEGMLPDEECIFFLLQDEVGKLIEGDRSFVKKSIARRRIFPLQEKLKFKYCQMGVPVPLAAKHKNERALRLSGTPVSRGIAMGRARIVRDEKDASDLKKGEIMVVESTDIGWTPFYNIVGGLITEIGSALSHGIVVAREYALPSVVNVINAMDLIKNGDMVTVDGNKGLVIIERK